MSLLRSGCRSLCITRARVRAQMNVNQLAHELTSAVARDLENPNGGGENSLSVYESSWVALVRDPVWSSRLAYPETFAWILGQQRPDGGWGPLGPYSALPTMAALLAIQSHPRRTPRLQRAIAAGSRYLQTILAGSDFAAINTPFLELLAPMVAEKLRAQGVAIPLTHLEPLRAHGAERRARLPVEALYHTRSPLIHALEAFGPKLDYHRLRARRTRDGGYGASPAATASVLLHAPEWDHTAARWLARLTRRGGRWSGGMPATHPLDVFEAAWTLHFLLQGGFQLSLRDTRIARMVAWLRSSIGPEGVGLARSRALPEDGDDTATALATLNDLGAPTSIDPLRAFEAAGHYLSYHGESSSSLSANAHALEALLSVAPRDGAALRGRIRSTTAYLLERCGPEGFWTDKWHISPFYATQACVHALARTMDAAAHQSLGSTLAWIAQMQRPDGGWGCGGSSVEETAYALLTIAAARRVVIPGSTENSPAKAPLSWIVGRGRNYLQQHMSDLAHPNRLPPMWVDKDLYAPTRIIRAAVLAALRISTTERQGTAI
jgi:halimadienyl-diphosphate synthase